MTRPVAVPSAFGILLLTLFGGVASGQATSDPDTSPPKDERAATADSISPRSADEPRVTQVLSELSLPGGLVFQPEGESLFFVENGAGRVRRLVAGKETADVLTGFSPVKTTERLDPTMGLFHLAFLESTHLLVAKGPENAGPEDPSPEAANPDAANPEAANPEAANPEAAEEGWIRVFPLPADESALSVDPLSPDRALAASEQLLGNRKLTGLVLSRTAAFVIARRDDSAIWLSRLERLEDELGSPADLAAETSPAQFGMPLSITMDPRGNLVIGLSRSDEDTIRSELLFCQAKTGEVWVRFPLPLQRITALAYHPNNGRLYALDFAHDDPSQGGLFELVATYDQGKPGVVARKILSLFRPTSMQFDASGVLFVTEWGEVDEHGGTGRLLRIELEVDP